jgi:ornithine cyclodeaminase
MRTAASAALAADKLHAPGDLEILGLIGCGLINREIVRFIASLGRRVNKIVAFDIDPTRAARYRDELAPIIGDVPFEPAPSASDVLKRSSVVSFATTAVRPTIADLSGVRPSTTILHISLRDLMPEAILSADNIVDDVDHVLRAATSVDLAKQTVGNAEFIRCTLADVITGRQPPRRDTHSAVVFSPFGLGVLDLAVARLAIRLAHEQRAGLRIDDFFSGT